MVDVQDLQCCKIICKICIVAHYFTKSHLAVEWIDAVNVHRTFKSVVKNIGALSETLTL